MKTEKLFLWNDLQIKSLSTAEENLQDSTLSWKEKGIHNTKKQQTNETFNILQIGIISVLYCNYTFTPCPNI